MTPLVEQWLRESYDWIRANARSSGITPETYGRGARQWLTSFSGLDQESINDVVRILEYLFTNTLSTSAPSSGTGGGPVATRPPTAGEEAASEQERQIALLKAEKDRLEGMFGPLVPIDPKNMELARQMPQAIRDMALRGQSLSPPLLFPSIGSLKFRSPQTLRNMTIPVQQMYERGLELQGLGPSDVQEFLRQERMTSDVVAPRYSRFGFAPLRVRRGF